MRIITEKEIEKLNISSNTCIKWVEEALSLKGDAILPPKISMKPYDEVFCNVMPSIVNIPGGERAGGVKIVSRYPGRTPTLESKLILFDAKSGDYKALIDANSITTLRTAAVAVHSVKLLAKKDWAIVGFIGMGEIGSATLKILLDTVNDREITVKIFDYKSRGRAFAEKYASYSNVSFEFYETISDTVSDSDVILSAPTYTENDFCSDECFKEGVLVVPIHTRGFTNCDLFFDKVFGDDYGHICHFKYFDKFRSFAETADVIKKNAVGRESDKERILAYNIGISLHDIFFAKKIFDLIETQK